MGATPARTFYKINVVCQKMDNKIKYFKVVLWTAQCL